MSNINKSIILQADSYKYSQYNQYPPGTEVVYSYIESRGGIWDKTVFFGLQMFLLEYLNKPITQTDILFAEQFFKLHKMPFYKEGWEYILREYGGYLPVTVKAIPEGTIVPTKNVLVVIEATDKECWWLPSFLETAIHRATWYPTTVATNSWICKSIIKENLEKTGDPSTVDFKLIDFGARGVSSLESCGIGGAAHLVNFRTTDNVSGILHVYEYYQPSEMPGFSVPAMEHSTVTSWGRENEIEAYRNMILTYGGNGNIVSIVADSYNIYEACKLFGTELKDLIQNYKGGTQLVIRPDSGEPTEVVRKCLDILDSYFGHTINDKGYKVLNTVRILQGDGINHKTIADILWEITLFGYSADNLLFGQGGALLQQIDRDTMKFAMKCSAVRVNNEWRDVYKDPITDSGKSSKKGRVTLFMNEKGEYYSGREDWMPSALETVFENGKVVKTYTFDEIRANANKF